MKLRQNVRHFASRAALELPVVGTIVSDRLVDLHTRIFLGRADPERADEREAHLEAFFERTMDAYLAALREGYPEAEAREITHIQANFDFYNHGWVEMMEFPTDEVDPHWERYADFFEAHEVTVADPLGAFEPAGGVPEAPATPEKLEDPEQPHAEGGYADDAYVETDEGEVVTGGREAPEDVDVRQAPGFDGETDS